MYSLPAKLWGRRCKCVVCDLKLWTAMKYLKEDDIL